MKTFCNNLFVVVVSLLLCYLGASCDLLEGCPLGTPGPWTFRATTFLLLWGCIQHLLAILEKLVVKVPA